jgi:UDP-glucose 4-epimerase
VNRSPHLERALGVARAARRGPGKPGEQRRSVLDPSLVMETFGIREWVPLAAGLRATAEWFRMHRTNMGL